MNYLLLSLLLPLCPLAAWDGQAWSQEAPPQQQWAMSLIDLAPIHEGDAILDVGCGDGFAAHYMRHRNPNGRIVALDSSPSMIEAGQHLYPDLEFLLADASQLEFHEEFDLITAITSLHRIPDTPSTLRRLARGLKGGGTLLISVPIPGIRASVEATRRQPPWETSFRSYTCAATFHTAQEWQQMGEACGLELADAWVDSHSTPIESPEQFASWISLWLDGLDCLPLEQRDPFLLTCAHRYLQEQGERLLTQENLILLMIKP